MSLRSEAIAAYRADWEATAREVLAETLKPFDVAGLQVLTLEVEADWTMVVLSDGDVHLAVTLPADGDATVRLVEDDGRGGWGDPDGGPVVITSLAHLGEVLPEFDPVDENATPAWDPNGVAYSVGDRVSYEGAIYECLQAHTSQAAWTPSSTPSLWTLVA